MFYKSHTLKFSSQKLLFQIKCYSIQVENNGINSEIITLNGKKYNRDKYTNVTPKILSYVGINNHNRPDHPLCLFKNRIIDYVYNNFKGRSGNPIFSIYDNINPVVSKYENFDSLLVPEQHPSRKRTDSYYLNENYMLRAHATAHQSELIKMGLDNFVVFGDVYRRDEIDSTHFPVFHQADGVHIFTPNELEQLSGAIINVFDKDKIENNQKQDVYSMEANEIVVNHLKNTLLSMIHEVFGENIPYRWVSEYFPFTHPSFELEINYKDKWIEALGCGVIKNEILKKAGAGNRIGWAFGLGLERLAMPFYSIPDIRLFWSNDSGFISQFENNSKDKRITYKPVSLYPQCINDISFWLPKEKSYCSNDFYELVGEQGGDIIEQVKLIDQFQHPKTGDASHCYRIVYRHLEKTLTQEEVNLVHKKIEKYAVKVLGVKIR
ncbi:probable phenylalanine--tRNA ligase, mitochondrial [Daktulosphaira vitifoliae]|uniref:probable phenylalanine--tRNA ligase, mitochondrial n=1 Tax=Daktulosphaira vitifoliae TaxID=58002 RepID=UPI0021A99B52|nr:probable phenylalanine--tRNA ligase, mitochondrial [Daktulosphaira vitifoliae]